MDNEQPYFLYVEDDVSSQQVMEVLLKEIMGFDHLTIFENSADFLSRLNALPNRPTVIILDIHIKPYDGYQLFKMIVQSGKFDDAIIVALTASVMSNEINNLRQAGFRNLIGKPINPVTFPQNLRLILDGQEIWDASWA